MWPPSSLVYRRFMHVDKCHVNACLRSRGAAGQGHENGSAPTTEVLLLERAKQDFVFTEVAERPVPSLLRGFSAPVKLEVGPHATSFVGG